MLEIEKVTNGQVTPNDFRPGGRCAEPADA
jgi:hypothetical protein